MVDPEAHGWVNAIPLSWVAWIEYLHKEIVPILSCTSEFNCLSLSVLLYIYDECKYSDAFSLTDRTRLFLQYTISLSSLCKLIWRHWTCKMPVKIYFVECVSKIKHVLSVIHYTKSGAVRFQFTHFPCDDWENIYTLSYYHHQIGSMNYYPLFRVRSWNNGVRCMSFYILMLLMQRII